MHILLNKLCGRSPVVRSRHSQSRFETHVTTINRLYEAWGRIRSTGRKFEVSGVFHTDCLVDPYGIFYLTGKREERQNVERVELVTRVHEPDEAFEYL